MWTDAGKAFENGSMTQSKMDEIVYRSIEQDGFSCMKEGKEELIDPELIPLKLNLYQCPKCDKVDSKAVIASHIPNVHTDENGNYE